MKKLAEHILEYVLEGSELPEDLIYEFAREILKIIKNGQILSISDEFWELENYVETFWRNEEFIKTKNFYIVYQMGQLLSLTSMISMIDDEEKRDLSVKDYAIQWKDYYSVFQRIHENRGITHKELAAASGMSISTLSQFINGVKWTGVFNCRLMGHEKYYYLTEYGERVYEVMKKNDVRIEFKKVSSEKRKEKIHRGENREDKHFRNRLIVNERNLKEFDDMDNEEKYRCKVS